MKTCIATAAIIGFASAAPQRMRTGVRSLQGSMPEVDESMSAPAVEPVNPVIAVDPTSPGIFDADETTAAPGTDAPKTEAPAEPQIEEPPVNVPQIEEPPADVPQIEEPPTSMSMPVPELYMSVPGVPVVLPEVLPEDTEPVIVFESLSIPAIYAEIHGASMSIPEGWTPEVDGFVPAETGVGYVAPESDDITGDDVEGDDVEDESDDKGEIAGEDDVVEDLDDEVELSGDDSSAAGVFVSGIASAACLVGAMALF